MLDVALDVDVKPFRHVKFQACHQVVCGLQGVPAIHRLVFVRVNQLVRQLLRARKESIEQVHHVAVRVGRDHVLGVHARCRLQAQALARLVLDAEARFGTHFGQRTVVLHAEARLHNPCATLDGVIHVSAQLGGVLLLLHAHPEGVRGLKVCAHADHFHPVLHVVLANHVLEVQAKVESLDFAEAIRRAHLVKVDAVVAQGKVAVQQHRAAWRNHGEVASTAHVAPAIIGKGDPRAVVQDTGKVVESKPEEAQLGTVPAAEGQFAVAVCEAERQATVIDVGVKQLRALFKVTVLHTHQVADATRIVGHGLQRAVDEDFGAKGARPHFTFRFTHVAILGPDVHDRADAPPVFRRKRSRIDVRVGQGV